MLLGSLYYSCILIVNNIGSAEYEYVGKQSRRNTDGSGG